MKKKITKIILAVCLVVAGLPLFAIGARANDDANTNSEMMISVDNYFDYRNAKLMTASFGAGYTADSMDYPALVCNDVAQIVPMTQELVIRVRIRIFAERRGENQLN